MQSLLKFSRFVNPGNASFAQDQLRNRLTIEVRDGSPIVLMNLKAYFQLPSLLVFFAILEKHTGAASQVVAELIQDER